FKRQVDTPEDDHSDYLSVRGVEMIHPYWDMALLQVDGLRTDKMLRLSVLSPDQLVNRNIVAVGYPALDPRNDAALQDKIFGGVYYVKRLQPGVVRERAKVRSFENQVNAMTHDASTLGGNSGSAVIDVDTGEVVALHFAGEYLKANYAVPMYELARDSRVAPKLNFQGSLTPTNDWAFAWRSVEGDESARGARAQPPAAAASGPPLQSPAPARAAAANDGVVTWTIPLNVSVSIGQPSASPAATRQLSGQAQQVAAAEDAEEAGGID